MSTINQSELTIIIRDIFQCVASPKLEKTLNEFYAGKQNKVSHMERIDQIDQSARLERKPKILSLVSLARRPIIDINIQITVVESGEVKYAIFGSDLRKYHMYLPKIQDKNMGRVFGPRVGIKHSRWYPQSASSFIKTISLYLRILDLYLKTNRITITSDYTIGGSGILGLEVPFDIPTEYKDLFEPEEICSDSNPNKKSSGTFIFGKNGVSADISDKMITQSAKFLGFNNIYPIKIKEPEDLIQFIKSPQIYAIGAWNRHARIFIKHTEINTVDIIDPWKSSIEYEILEKFNKSAWANDWNVGFVKRGTVDQARGEGSCVLASFARLLFLVHGCPGVPESKNYDIPIPDFYAFFASYLYRKTR
jgi:hypothetical protein